jgi:hypothetical protein
MFLSSFWGLSLSMSLWSDQAVFALVKDARAPLWLHYMQSAFERVSREKGAK